MCRRLRLGVKLCAGINEIALDLTLPRNFLRQPLICSVFSLTCSAMQPTDSWTRARPTRFLVISATELARIWEQHAAGLLLLARARCPSAEDCVQEAFVRLAVQPTVPDEPVAWLARVVRNLAISQLRSDQHRRIREEKASRERPEWFTSQRESSADELQPADVQTSLSGLDSQAREIVVAHLWSGLSFRQIALAFDISPSMAHRRYVDALERLRQSLVVQRTER